jgi:hypothetical protein
VTAGLYALRDDYIDIRLCRALRIRDRTDLMENLAATGVHAFDIQRGIAPEKRNDRHTLLDADCDLCIDRKMQNQIYAERFVREFANALNFAAEQRWRRELCLQNSQATSVTHGGDQLRASQIGTHWRGNDRMLNAEEFAQRRSQHGAINANVRSGCERRPHQTVLPNVPALSLLRLRDCAEAHSLPAIRGDDVRRARRHLPRD